MHLLVIAVVALVVLGPERLPSALGRVGAAVREFKRVSDAISHGLPDILSLDDAATSDPHDPPPAAVRAAAPPRAPAPPPQVRGGEFHDSVHPRGFVAPENEPEASGGLDTTARLPSG